MEKFSEGSTLNHAGNCGIGKRLATREDLLQPKGCFQGDFRMADQPGADRNCSTTSPLFTGNPHLLSQGP